MDLFLTVGCFGVELYPASFNNVGDLVPPLERLSCHGRIKFRSLIKYFAITEAHQYLATSSKSLL